MMTKQPPVQSPVDEPLRLKKRSNMGEVWHRLKKNKLSMISLVFLLVLILAIIFVPFISPYDYDAQDMTQRFQLPNAAHIMGTDDFGRDLFTRLLMADGIRS